MSAGSTVGCVVGAVFAVVSTACDSSGSGSALGPLDGGPEAAGASAGAPSTGGAGAAGGSAGAQSKGGAKATGGASGAGGSVSLRAACRAYLMAGCIRRAECGADGSGRQDVGSALQCGEQLLGKCPDYTFSPGSTRTADGLFACASDWKAWPCANVDQGASPPCGLPGTRAAGEPCLFASQCASLSCSSYGSVATCATCLAVAPPGGACDAMTLCPGGQYCSGSQCVPNTATLPTEKPIALRMPGASCVFGDTCWEDNVCVQDPTDDHIGTCGAAALPGEPCTQPVLGQSKICWLGTACGPDGLCPAATPCTAGPSCAANQACACSGGTCGCHRPREEGATCNPPVAPCAAGLECRSGRCVATDALTLYGTVCGSP